MTQTPEQIAAKLTRAQREALTYDGFWWQGGRQQIAGNGAALRALHRKGLCIASPLWKVTDLGLAVRDVILRERAEG